MKNKNSRKLQQKYYYITDGKKRIALISVSVPLETLPTRGKIDNNINKNNDNNKSNSNNNNNNNNTDNENNNDSKSNNSNTTKSDKW